MSSDPVTTEVTLESAIEHAKRAFALKKYEEAVDHYATALELITEKFGENAPETADLYLSYGKALLENAISQSSVLGKDQPEDGAADENNASGSSTNGPLLSFSGDAEEMDEDTAVDLFAQAAKDVAEAEAAAEEEDENEDEDAEPEDDFNAAWEVLDLARAIYDKQREADDDEEVKLKLADTYIALGDVSLETEKFDQAITDYEAGLALKVDLLPPSSRQIAEAHYKLSIVLDLTSGRLADAIVHVEKALESIESRLSLLKDRLANPPSAETTETKPDVKGKGKASGARLVRDDVLPSSPAQIEGEIKDLAELKEDLVLKIEELKTSPNEAIASNAPALVAQVLDQELNAGGASSAAPVQETVNDLTSMVVKKKKKAPAEDSAAPKRKAEDAAEDVNSEKKAKMDTEP